MIFTTAKQMEKLDDLAVKNGLAIRQMMELAGAAILDVFRLLNLGQNKKVLIVAGKGNKGGDGLSAARHLINHGYRVELVLMDRKLKPDPRHHLKLLKKMGAKVRYWDKDWIKFVKYDVIIDSLIGYHLKGAPKKPYARAIKDINNSKKKVIAYDLPSGMDATSGQCEGECVKADATLTLAAPKKCFQTRNGKKLSGKIFLADIGIPKFLYEQVVSRYQSPFVGKTVLEIGFN